jgi:hypothetical protein
LVTQPQTPETQSDASNGKAPKKSGKLPPAPATSTAVNLAIAEIVLRGVADRMRGRVNADLSAADKHKRETGEKDAVDGRSLLTSIGLYGAARLAQKSRAGLGLVAGGLLAKSLYERGKAVRERRNKSKDDGGSKAQ